MKYKFNRYQKAWIKALKSGKYKQRKAHLSNDNHTAHCCLGVACEVVNDLLAKSKKRKQYWDSYDSRPPERIANLLSIENSGINKLINFNDIEGLSFKQIAEEIEIDPYQYFA